MRGQVGLFGMKRKFRLGSTSYVYPDDILPNVRKLMSSVDDIELVLFEVDDYGTNLPNAAVIKELNALARDNDLTYTVHLPIDLDWHDARTFDKIYRALDATRTLDPFAYVLHLDGHPLVGEPSPEIIARWQDETSQALDQVLARVNPLRLCIENLEKWAPEYFAELVLDNNLARCVDVGHLWVQQRDPLAHLRKYVEQTRVVHIHGIHGRDHQSLVWQPRADVMSVLDLLSDAKFAGVLTLEVFNLDDFRSSKQLVEQWENSSL